ncbi:hypothetical protein TNCV_4165211 [Trichonephila clavipes]|nr:hypothetical protein TNCV_4165211 [Trichonephila clavipes]
MWASNDLNEEECWPVTTKTHPQCQCDRVIYSLPDVNKIQRHSWEQMCRPIVTKHQWNGSLIDGLADEALDVLQSWKLLRFPVFSLRGQPHLKDQGDEHCRLVKDGVLGSAEQ